MPQTVLLMILAVVFTAVLSVVQGLYWAYVARQEREQEELLRRLTGGGGEVIQESLVREQQNDAAAKALGGFGARIQEAIIASDSQLTVSGVAIRMLALGVVGVGVGLLVVGPPGILLGGVAAYVPYAVLRYQADNRAKELVSQLPDALDLMARSLQAGVGLNDSFRLVAEEMPLPVAGEFGRVFEEVRFGRDYREAFHKMLDRNPGVFDLRLMVSSILLQRETGGNLIEILENIATTIRARFGFQAKVRAMTAEAKFSAIVLGGLPLGVIMILMVTNPTYLNPLMEDTVGNMIIAFDILMYGSGIMIMRDLTNVEV